MICTYNGVQHSMTLAVGCVVFINKTYGNNKPDLKHKVRHHLFALLCFFEFMIYKDLK